MGAYGLTRLRWRGSNVVASIVLIGLSLYVQLRLEDTPAFQALQQARLVSSDVLGQQQMRPG